MQNQTVNNMVKFVVVEDGQDAGMIVENGQLNEDGIDMMYQAIEEDGMVELEAKESTVALLNEAFQEELMTMINNTEKDMVVHTYQDKVAPDVLNMMEEIVFGVPEEVIETAETPDEDAELLLKEEEELARLEDYGIAPGFLLSTPSGGDMVINDINVMKHESSVKVTMASGEVRFVDAEYLVRQVEHAQAIDQEDEMYEQERQLREQVRLEQRKEQREADDAKIRNNKAFQQLRRFRRNGNTPDNPQNTPASERAGMGNQ